MGERLTLPLTLDTLRNFEHMLPDCLKDNLLVLSGNPCQAVQIFCYGKHALICTVVEHSWIAGGRRSFREWRILSLDHF